MRRMTYICDRCRCEYRFDQREVNNRNLNLVDIEDDKYDLCLKCQEGLEKWFDEVYENDNK